MITKGTTTEPRQPGGESPVPGHTGELLEDWITIWQSELAALVLDREAQDTMLRLIDGWAGHSRAIVALAAPRDAPRPAGADAAARSASVAAAPDERDILVQQLLARVAELERHVADASSPDSISDRRP